VLPSKYLMQKQEDVIVQEAGGYTKLDDGCGFEVDWKHKIEEELELKPAAYWEQRGGVRRSRCLVTPSGYSPVRSV
jgi:hypothetical protein